jgi:hypothetical protein
VASGLTFLRCVINLKSIEYVALNSGNCGCTLDHFLKCDMQQKASTGLSHIRQSDNLSPTNNRRRSSDVKHSEERKTVNHIYL